MDGECKNTEEINGYHPEFLEGDIDTTVNILNGFIIAGVRDDLKIFGDAHLPPEITHVKAQESKDEDTEQSHVFGGPGRSGHFAAGIPGALGDAVGAEEDDSLNRVEEDKGIESDRYDPDQRVLRHKRRVDIEGFSSIIGQQLQVAGHVDDQEGNQEEAGEAHDHFLAHRGSQKSGKPGHNRNSLKNRVQDRKGGGEGKGEGVDTRLVVSLPNNVRFYYYLFDLKIV